MGAYIAVKGCELKLDSGQGDISIETDPKDTMSIDGNKVYAGSLTIKVSNYTGSDITLGDGEGTATLEPGAVNCTLDGDYLVLEGDSVSIELDGYKPSSSGAGKEPAHDSDTVTISSAGQSTIKAD